METRKNPMLWDDAPAEGVLAPLERDPLGFDSQPSLLGLPDGGSMLGQRRGEAPEGGASADVHAVFAALADGLRRVVDSNTASRINLDSMSEEDLDVLKDALGRGEVTMMLTGGEGDDGEAQIAETAFPGVWLGRASMGVNGGASYWLEVADAPFALRRLAVTRPQLSLDIASLTPPRGAMNVMSVLSEIGERSKAWTPGTDNHVINFTLFPMSAQDAAYLASTLGEVGVTVMSGGYGVARVLMTAVPHVWAVQYLNGMGVTILDTIEIGDVPTCVLASKEDFEDSLMRLGNIVEAYSA